MPETTSPITDWTDRAHIRSAGFMGFLPIGRLWEDGLDPIPAVPGVYLVVRPPDDGDPDNPSALPRFLATGTAGWFKGKDPNVSIDKLTRSWVPGTPVVYIGKAGKPGGRATLRSRLRQYLAIGHGDRAPHWGGRYIWQLERAGHLQFCWKPLPGRNDGEDDAQDPRDVERAMITSFEAQMGKPPFANLMR